MFVPIRAVLVGDVRMLLLVVDSVPALDSSRVDIVRVKSVGYLVLVVIVNEDGCSFYEQDAQASSLWRCSAFSGGRFCNNTGPGESGRRRFVGDARSCTTRSCTTTEASEISEIGRLRF